MIRLRSLGECTIEVGDTRLGPQQEIAFGLALLLSFERGRAVARQEILDLLWPRVARDRASHCLRQTHYRIRSLGIPTEATKASIVLPGEAVVRDLDEWLSSTYEERLTNPHVGHGVLPQYEPAFSEGFAEYVERHRTRANAQIRQRLVEDLETARSMHRWRDVDVLARLVLQLDPLHEAATLALAEATARTGARREAVTILDGYIREVGSGGEVLTRPAVALRRRISEYTPPGPVTAPADQCFVGRGREVASLLGMVHRAMEGSGGAVWVSGPAGIGKTRLVQEVLTSARFRGVRTLQIALRPIDQHHPLSGAAQLAAGVLKMRGALGCSPESLSCLKELNSGSAETTEQDRSIPAVTRLPALSRAFVDVLEALASEAPHVIAIDDVQWLDDLSWSLLSSLVASCAGIQIFVVVASRSFSGDSAIAQDIASKISLLNLAPLTREASCELFSQATSLAPSPPDEQHVSWCLELAQGNPLFLKALGAHWLEVATPLMLPPSLAEILRVRVQQLDDRSRLVLQACALLGRHATHAHLEAVLELPSYMICSALVVLERAGMLSEENPLQPRHELIADAVLQELPPSAKKLLHRRVALVLERELMDSVYSPRLWDVAHHWTASGEASRVVPVALRCATHLVSLGFPAEAADLLEKTYAYCGDLASRFEVVTARTQALHLAGRFTTASLEVAEARKLGTALTPPSHKWHSEIEFIGLEARWRQDESPELLLAEARECVADAMASYEHRLTAARWALVFADNMGVPACAHSIFAAALPLVTPELRTSAAWATVELIYHASFGDLDRAIAAGTALIDCQRRHQSPAELARALRFTAVVLFALNRETEGEAALLEAIETGRRHRLPRVASVAAEHLGFHLLQGNRIEEADQWARAASSFYRTHGDDRVLVQDLAELHARIALARRNPEMARHLSNPTLPELLADKIECRRQMRLSYFVRLRLALGEHVDEQVVVALESMVRNRFSRLGQDGPVYTTALALSAQGKATEARDLISEYAVKWRRDRRPLPAPLVQLTETNGNVGSARAEYSLLLGLEN